MVTGVTYVMSCMLQVLRYEHDYDRTPVKTIPVTTMCFLIMKLINEVATCAFDLF